VDHLEQPAGKAEHLKLLFTRYDPLEMLRLSTPPQLRQARTVAYDLADYGSLHLSHALLMPDTPGMAALRSLINDLGLAPWLMNILLTIHDTEGFATCLASCLHPVYSATHKILADQVAALPPFPGTEEGARSFVTEWFDAIRILGQKPANS
jgi:hypothetical protein